MKKENIVLENGNQIVLEYNKIFDILTKYNDKGIEIWTYEIVKDHKKNPLRGSGKIGGLIKRGKHEEKTWEPTEYIKKYDPVTL